jgi:hypothetical protein
MIQIKYVFGKWTASKLALAFSCAAFGRVAAREWLEALHAHARMRLPRDRTLAGGPGPLARLR